MGGELKKLQRMVQRRDLKTQIRLLKQIIATHEPLVKARLITQKAFTQGKLAGAQEMVAQIEAAEREKNVAQPTVSVEPDISVDPSASIFQEAVEPNR